MNNIIKTVVIIISGVLLAMAAIFIALLFGLSLINTALLSAMLVTWSSIAYLHEIRFQEELSWEALAVYAMGLVGLSGLLVSAIEFVGTILLGGPSIF